MIVATIVVILIWISFPLDLVLVWLFGSNRGKTLVLLSPLSLGLDRRLRLRWKAVGNQKRIRN
ncbi:hypothetical protein GTO27_01770 [Candidatus Bathyarchaeota archaeon]|nr:hypothetical protein [Candidatus Bathyarchaeota archaeon]